jgi:oligopeptide/dipeptide ABC transporter ATP-binding protein
MIVVTHDFGVVAKMCTEVAVMYAGKIVEKAAVREIFNHPMHPYTQAMMKSVPKVEERVERLASIEGQPPLLYNLPPGCAFKDRCQFISPQCEEYPPLVEIKPGHFASCWRISPNHD